MRIVVLALALLPATAIAGERAAPLPAPHFKLPAKAASQCQNARSDYAVSPAEPARARTLQQEPQAAQYLGVLRMEDGCDLPVKIADKLGDKQR
jgi:hypothetical protein